MERKQRIQTLLDRLDVLEGKSSKKTRIQGLLARLDAISKEKEDTKKRQKEVSSLVSKHPKFKQILSKLGDARKENASRFKQVDKSFREETEALRSELATASQTGVEFTEARVGAILARIEELEASFADNLQAFDTNDALLEAEIASVRAEMAKIEIPDVSGIKTAQEGVQSLIEALEELEKRVNSRIANIQQRGGGNANRQILVDGNQSTLGYFTDINLIPGSNMGIAVGVDQTSKRTNFTLFGTTPPTSSALAAGTVGNVQYNDTGSVFGASADFNWNKNTSVLSANNVTTSLLTATTRVLSKSGGSASDLAFKFGSLDTGFYAPTSGTDRIEVVVNGGNPIDIEASRLLVNGVGGLNVSNGPVVIGSIGGVLKTTSGTVSGGATTTDLPEGSNQYFTDERAQDAVGTMVDGTLVYTDAGPTLSRSSIVGDISIPQGSVIATLPNVNANAGTFGDNVTVSRVTVNAKGQVTAASSVGIAFPAVPAGVTSVVAGGGITVGNGNPAAPIVERSSIAGDVTIAQGSVISTLAAVASNVGTFGSSTTVPQVQIDTKGRVVLASTVGIAFPAATTPAGFNTQVQFNDGGAFGASSTFAWNKNTSVLSVGNSATASVLTVDGPSSIMGLFGQMGVGIASPTAPLHIYTTLPGTALNVEQFPTAVSGIGVGFANTYTANTTSVSGFIFALNNSANIAATDDAAWTTLSSGASTSTYNGTGSLGTLTGAQFTAARAGASAGNVTTQQGLLVSRTNTTGSGTITTSRGIMVNRPTNAAGGTITNSYGIFIQNQTTAAGTHTNTPYGIYQEGTGDRNFFGGQVGIGTATPNANAILDCVSTTKPFMPPRMTTTQRDNVSSPTAGMVIYNTSTNKLNVYTTAWEAITSA